MSRVMFVRHLPTLSLSGQLLVALMALGVAAACTTTPSTRPPANPSTSLSGKWTGSSGGLSVLLTLEQMGDSVTGSGTYQVASGSSLGCGGETIPASGPVSLTGTLTSGEFQGRMSFGGAWIPPYLGSLKTPDSLDARFMSVDRGACTLPLTRQR